MLGIYDITDKTYVRPADRIDALLGSEEQAFGKYAGHFSGAVWNVPHNLRSTNLLIGIWKDDPSNHASYWSIQQIDYENLQINWTLPVEGRVVLYSVRPFVGVAVVHEQTSADTVWTITHNFGTQDVMYTCWTGGTIITPVSAQTLDNNTVELTFAFPVTGTCVMVIADPEINPSIHVDWTNIYNLPTSFPPSPHTHPATDITGDGIDITTLGGHPVEEFVLKDDVGKTVAPLQPRVGSSPVEYEIPQQFMPIPILYQFGDSDGVVNVTRVIAQSSGDHPLYVTKNPITKEATLDVKPVLRKIKLAGNYVINPGIPDHTVRIDNTYSMRLMVGAGLSAKAEDQHTLKLSLASGAGATFTRAVLNAGEEWDVLSPVFEVQGGYILGLYETSIPPSPILTTKTNHVPLVSPPLDDINMVFEVKGDQILELSGQVTSDIMDYSDDHFIFEDQIMTENDIPVNAPDDVDAIYWDTSDNTYIMRSPMLTGTGWSYRKFSVSTKSSYLYGVALNSSTYKHTAVSGAYIYALHNLGSNGFELLYALFSDIPVWAWANKTTFSTEAMPIVSSGGKLKFRIQGDMMYLLNTTLNSFAVYSISGGIKMWEKPLTYVAEDFDLWPDGYASFCLEGEDSLWVTDRPVSDYDFVLRKSIDYGMGGCRAFALRDDGKGALGVVDPDLIRYSGTSQMDTITAYKTGETVLWLREPYCWKVPLTWSQMLSMAWKAYDTGAYDDIRIGFFPGGSATLPSTLYSWDGMNFNPFPASDLPVFGQPLSTVNSIQLVTGDKLSYAIYIKKSPSKALEKGSITHNFTVTYKNAGIMYPVPIGGPYNNTDHVEVQCASGAIKIINTLGRTLNGLKLVATPAI